jgi:hypothetical protein
VGTGKNNAGNAVEDVFTQSWSDMNGCRCQDDAWLSPTEAALQPVNLVFETLIEPAGYQIRKTFASPGCCLEFDSQFVSAYLTSHFLDAVGQRV